MKITLLFLIFVSISFIGYYFSSRYYKKIKLFESLKQFLNYIKLNIDFQSIDLITLLENYKSNNNDFQKIIEDYKTHIEDLFEMTYFKVTTSILKEDEKEMIESCFCNLGNLPKYLQLENIDKCLQLLNNTISVTLEKEKQCGKLPIKLSFSIGLMIIIILF